MKTKQCYEHHTKCNGNTCNKEQQHTPTLSVKKKGDYYQVVYGKYDDEFCSTLHKEHADEIIRAINSHEALLDAAKYALQAIRYIAPNESEDVIEKLSKAIAQVNGGK